MSINKQRILDNHTLRKVHSSELKILNEIVRICEKYNLNYFLIGGTLLGAVRHKGFIPWDDDLDIAMPREDYEEFIKIAPNELSDDFVLDDISTSNHYWLIFAKVRLKNTIYKTDTELTNKYNGIWVDIFPFDYTKHFKDKFIKLKWSKIRLLKAVYIRKNPSSKQPPHAIVSILSVFLKPLSATKLNKLIKNSITKENKNNERKYFINYGSQYGIIKQTHRIDKILPLTKAIFEGKEYRVPKDSDYVLKNIYGPNYMQLPPKEKRITHNPDFIKFEDGEKIHFDNEKE